MFHWRHPAPQNPAPCDKQFLRISWEVCSWENQGFYAINNSDYSSDYSSDYNSDYSSDYSSD